MPTVPIGCLFLRGDIFSGVCRNCLLSYFLFCRRMPNKAQLRVNNKRKHVHQMRANACLGTRLRKIGACVLRVRRLLISDLYCNLTVIFGPKCSLQCHTPSGNALSLLLFTYIFCSLLQKQLHLIILRLILPPYQICCWSRGTEQWTHSTVVLLYLAPLYYTQFFLDL